MTDSTEALARGVSNRRRAWRLAIHPRGDLGIRLHRPLADRPGALHGRPAHRLVPDVPHELRPASPGDQTRFIGIDNYIRWTSDPLVGQGTHLDIQVRTHRHPPDHGRQPGLRAAAESPELAVKGPFRTLFYMPIMIPLVASTLVWTGFLNTDTGWLNGVLGMVRDHGTGLDQQRPLDLSGSVADRPVGDRQLHDHQHRRPAIRADRALRGREDRWRGWWKSFRRITIPLMSPVLLYDLVIVADRASQYFTQAYMLSNGRGEPNNATLFINLDLYREAFSYNHMGYASAIAWILFVIVLVIALLSLPTRVTRVLRRCGPMTADSANTQLRSWSDRSPVGRIYKRYIGKSLLTLFATLLIIAFLLPLLYMLAQSFESPSQSVTPGAPAYPAAPATGTYQGETYPIYAVPMPDGSTRNLMLIKKGRESSIFVDPADSTATRSTWQGRWRTLDQAWQFAPIVDNFVDVWKQLNFPPAVLQHGGDRRDQHHRRGLLGDAGRLWLLAVPIPGRTSCSSSCWHDHPAVAGHARPDLRHLHAARLDRHVAAADGSAPVR